MFPCCKRGKDRIRHSILSMGCISKISRAEISFAIVHTETRRSLSLSITIAGALNRAYFYIYLVTLLLAMPRDDETKLPRTFNATRQSCYGNLRYSTRTWKRGKGEGERKRKKEKDVLPVRVLAIFWSLFLQFRPRAIRNRYRYWWHTNETTWPAFGAPWTSLVISQRGSSAYRTLLPSSSSLLRFSRENSS